MYLLSFVILSTFCACEKQNIELKTDISNSKQILCKECGEKNLLTNNFCGNCGASTNSASFSSKIEIPEENFEKTTTSNNTVDSTHIHTYDIITISKQPTCIEQGLKTYCCSSCSSTKSEYIAAMGHIWEEATCLSPKKCSSCNTTDGSNLEHAYINNNCILCNKEKIIFNYEKNHFPVKIIEPQGSQKGKVEILNAYCYIQSEEVYINITCEVEPVNYRNSTNVIAKLISSNGEKVAEQLISLAWWNLPRGETTYDKRLVSWNDFCKLEPDIYQVIIEIIY